MASQHKDKGKAAVNAVQTKNVSGKAIPAPEDIDANVKLLQRLYENFHFRCKRSSCGATLSLGSFKGRVDKWCADSKVSQPNQLSMVACIKCRAITCVGCGRSPIIGSMRVKTPLATVTNCCDRGRLFGIWLLLARFDNAEVEDRQEAAENTRPPVVPSAPSSHSNGSAWDSPKAANSTAQAAVPPTARSYGSAWADLGMNEGLDGDFQVPKYAPTSSSAFHLGGTGYAGSSYKAFTYQTQSMTPNPFSQPIPISYGSSYQNPSTTLNSYSQPILSNGSSSQAQASSTKFLPKPIPISNGSSSQNKSITRGLVSQPTADPRKKRHDIFDGFLAGSLILLSAFLPNSDVNSNFDRNPPAELFALFQVSFLFDRVNSLIRNDSIDDMAQRSELYEAVFDFVTKISKHRNLVSLVTEKRAGKKNFPGIQKICEEAGSGENATEYFDGSRNGLVASVVSCCRDTHKQARSYEELSKKRSMGPGANSKDRRTALRLCGRVIDFLKTIEKTAPNALNDCVSEKDAWIQFYEENRVTFTDDVLTAHMFHSEFSKLTYSKPGRMSVLGKEIANLSTSLPPGIFLKIGDSRQDVMKALIVGVENTPYAGGLFILDIFLPPEWPTGPPKVYSVLDEGFDRRRGNPSLEVGGLNPNVHTDGKICLSLLNTWSGSASELWQPNKSTLLSVFVSIQSMIFGAKYPLLSEPHLENRSPFSEESRTYTKHVQCKTVSRAMLWWLTSYRAKNGVWATVSSTYWSIKGREVLSTVNEWAKTNEQLRRYDTSKSWRFSRQGGYAAELAELQGSLGVDLLAELSKNLGSWVPGSS